MIGGHHTRRLVNRVIKSTFHHSARCSRLINHPVNQVRYLTSQSHESANIQTSKLSINKIEETAESTIRQNNKTSQDLVDKQTNNQSINQSNKQTVNSVKQQQINNSVKQREKKKPGKPQHVVNQALQRFQSTSTPVDFEHLINVFSTHATTYFKHWIQALDWLIEQNRIAEARLLWSKWNELPRDDARSRKRPDRIICGSILAYGLRLNPTISRSNNQSNSIDQQQQPTTELTASQLFDQLANDMSLDVDSTAHDIIIQSLIDCGAVEDALYWLNELYRVELFRAPMSIELEVKLIALLLEQSIVSDSTWESTNQSIKQTINMCVERVWVRHLNTFNHLSARLCLPIITAFTLMDNVKMVKTVVDKMMAIPLIEFDEIDFEELSHLLTHHGLVDRIDQFQSKMVLAGTSNITLKSLLNASDLRQFDRIVIRNTLEHLVDTNRFEDMQRLVTHWMSFWPKNAADYHANATSLPGRQEITMLVSVNYLTTGQAIQWLNLYNVTPSRTDYDKLIESKFVNAPLEAIQWVEHSQMRNNHEICILDLHVQAMSSLLDRADTEDKGYELAIKVWKQYQVTNGEFSFNWNTVFMRAFELKTDYVHAAQLWKMAMINSSNDEQNVDIARLGMRAVAVYEKFLRQQPDLRTNEEGVKKIDDFMMKLGRLVA